MTGSILDGKVILAVDDDPEASKLLEERILDTCPGCRVDKAFTYQEGAAKIGSSNYDLVLLDTLGVRGFDLLNMAVTRDFPAVMLAACPLSPGALRRSIEMGARAYFPKEKLGEIVPLLEDVLTSAYLPGWKRVFEKMKDQIDNGHIAWGVMTPTKRQRKK